uniref:Uncharacterized protein n=1 Tax=Magallana gigas TaxID=29159 RepID=K1QVY4_MAGGI
MGSLVDSCKETTKRGKKKIRSRQTFMFSGEKVCRNAFLPVFVYDIGKHYLHNIIINKNAHGVTPRKHGNLEKKPSHSQHYNDIKLVVQFISSYADDFGLPQPAAPRGRDDTPPIYIPSDARKSTRNMLKAVRTTDKCGIPHFATSGTSVFCISD